MRLIKKLLVAIAVCSTPASAINVGDTAPQFSLSTYGGGTFDLAQQKGKVTVLLFLCCKWPPAWAIGSMVEDSIAEKFSSSSVSVAGLDVYDANDAEIKWLIDTAHITFPIAKNGDSIRLFYAAYYYSIVVIDKNGIVQFIADSLDITEASDKKSVSDAAAKVRNLLGSRVVRPAATTALKGRNSVGVPRCYTLSGQRIPQLMTSVRAGIVVLRRDGKGTEFARFKKPNP